jgi:hypothetical protein
MASIKKAKKQVAKRERKERRFAAEETYASRITVYAGMLGSLALGSGVYAQWLREEPLRFGPYLLGAGALLLLGALYKGGGEVGSVRIGDAGVALEKGNELVRILWCDLERVSLENGVVTARGKDAQISFPAEAHPRAMAWLLSEGGRRVPDVIALSRTEIERFGEPKELEGELITVEDLQVAGRHCRASGKPISFERDARLCPNCSEAYLKDQVPKKCLTCHAELGNRAREA